MNYVICSSGRARSSVLMHFLKQLGAGLPDEWTNPWFYSQFEAGNFDALCRFIQSREIDGHTGLRMTWKGLIRVCYIYDCKAKPFFDAALPGAKFIYFERDNLAQTVESVYYEQLQMFDDVPSYVPAKRIEEMLVECALDGSSWEMFFAENNIKPYRLTYEQLIADRNSACLGVLRFLAIRPPEQLFLQDYKTYDNLNDVEDIGLWYNEFMKRYERII